MKDEKVKRLWGKETKFGISGATYAGRVGLLAGQLTRKYGKLTILDYGCGEGTLFKTMPDIVNLETVMYDPCIKGLDKHPEPADIVVCTDVLEHVEPECLNNVLDDLQKLTKIVCFVSVCLTPAEKTYPDGRNTHLTLMERDFWYAKFRSRFNVIENNTEKFPGGHEKFVCVLQAKDVKPVVKSTEKSMEQLAEEYSVVCEPIISEFCSKCEDHCYQECADNNGWFNGGGDTTKLKEDYGFDSKYGFLDKDTKNCKVPRTFRSVRCQGWICEKLRKNKNIINQLEEIDACMRYVRKAEGMPV
jgi:hypothetical protein